MFLMFAGTLAGNVVCASALAKPSKPNTLGTARFWPLCPIVPKGQNMNSRGRQPTVKREKTFDPVGVAHFCSIPPWVCTHGYSCLAASRLAVQARLVMRCELRLLKTPPTISNAPSPTPARRTRRFLPTGGLCRTRSASSSGFRYTGGTSPPASRRNPLFHPCGPSA